MSTASPAQALLKQILSYADITLNGPNPWDPQIHRAEFYQRLLTHYSLGLGEAYMDGWWDCAQLDEFFARVIAANLPGKIKQEWRLCMAFARLKTQEMWRRLINYQSKTKALVVGKQHYDISNELYSLMLDPRMNYSCGYWRNANNLNDAQVAKLELACQKLQLQPGMKVLDIGCGWGSFAEYAASHYGVRVVGITISQQQCQAAQLRCKGLPVEIRFQDYRDVTEKFDRICSIGMFEHVGPKNYRHYFQIAHQCLKDDGLFLLHTIGSNVSMVWTDAWINRYIFPHGVLPSIQQIGRALEGLWVMEDWHNFGANYDPTLMAWHHNFNAHWEQLKSQYDERFYRMWNYYLLSCAGAFRARDLQLWQIVLSKYGVKGGYNSVR